MKYKHKNLMGRILHGVLVAACVNALFSVPVKRQAFDPASPAVLETHQCCEVFYATMTIKKHGDSHPAGVDQALSPRTVLSPHYEGVAGLISASEASSFTRSLIYTQTTSSCL